MQTYTTLDGEVLDLTSLTDEERAYLERCYAAYRDGMPYTGFANSLIYGPENPLLRAANGLVRLEVWRHPLFRAVRDLEYRLGIAQRRIGPMLGDDLDRDPLEDEWLTTPEAQQRKGVGHTALHHAIRQGKLIAHPAQDGGTRLHVSARSLAAWQPSEARQAAKRPDRDRAGA